MKFLRNPVSKPENRRARAHFGASPTSRQLSHLLCDPASLLFCLFLPDLLVCLQVPFLPSTCSSSVPFQDIFLKHTHDCDTRSLSKGAFLLHAAQLLGSGPQLYLSTLLFPRYTLYPSHTSLICSAGYRGTMFFCTFLSWLILSPFPRSSVDSFSKHSPTQMSPYLPSFPDA